MTPHAKQRADERYGLSVKELQEIETQIRQRRGVKFLCHESTDKLLFKVIYNGLTVYVVYAPNKGIITTLPRDVAGEYLRSRSREGRITTKPEPKFVIPNEWLDNDG